MRGRRRSGKPDPGRTAFHRPAAAAQCAGFRPGGRGRAPRLPGGARLRGEPPGDAGAAHRRPAREHSRGVRGRRAKRRRRDHRPDDALGGLGAGRCGPSQRRDARAQRGRRRRAAPAAPLHLRAFGGRRGPHRGAHGVRARAARGGGRAGVELPRQAPEPGLCRRVVLARRKDQRRSRVRVPGRPCRLAPRSRGLAGAAHFPRRGGRSGAHRSPLPEQPDGGVRDLADQRRQDRPARQQRSERCSLRRHALAGAARSRGGDGLPAPRGLFDGASALLRR